MNEIYKDLQFKIYANKKSHILEHFKIKSNKSNRMITLEM